jgi:hypothetical protein
MFRDTQFNGFGSQEPQCPTAVAFGRFPAAQGDDLSSRFSGYYRSHRRGFPYLPVQYAPYPFLFILPANPGHKGGLTVVTDKNIMKTKSMGRNARVWSVYGGNFKY